MTTKNAQLRRKSVVLYRQDEVNYVTASPTPGDMQCANCRWFSYADRHGRSGCAIVEEYPTDIMPTGVCDEHTPIPPEALPQPPEPLEVAIVDVEPSALLMLAPVQERGLKDRVLLKDRPYGQTFWKAEDGLRRALLVTSNGYKDREHEHVATKALEAYVDSCYNKAGEYIGENRLDFWHDKQLDIGSIECAVMIDGFLIEIGKERPHPVVKAIWDYWEETATNGDIKWGASHEFYSLDPQQNVHTDIRKVKTSVLPLEAAANLYTFSGVV